ncbi:MAG: response regulator MprA [Parcubacteria group bacterium]|nr:response regulator MprA [Parcubacteria group bacterium]
MTIGIDIRYNRVMREYSHHVWVGALVAAIVVVLLVGHFTQPQKAALEISTVTPPVIVAPHEGFADATFAGVSLRLELATTTQMRERGLGGRSMIDSDYGMLFAFPKEDRYGFWMKDTLIPLDIFWLDSKGQVVSVAREVSPSSYPNVFYPSGPSRYVLETLSGFALANGIATGTPLLLKNFPTVSE